MKKLFLIGLLAFICTALYAQNDLINLRLEARADYQREYIDGDDVEDNCGFDGKFLNIRMDGHIGQGFSYSYRQRLNKANKDQSFFDATDWIYLTYTKNNWSLSAGKLVVGIGGYEYDRAPIDLYFCSEYWHNIPCYQFGVSGAYTTDSGNDKFMVQFCESPFMGELSDMYSYNIMWYGSHGWFNTIYSVNLIEYAPCKYISYIAFGNKFNMGNMSLELDFMNRAASGQTFIGKNISVVGELSWRPNKKLNIFGKVSYDVNDTESAADLCVLPGTEITRVGAGVEYFPLKDAVNDVRIHASGSYTFGDNGNVAGALLDKQTFFNVGVTWRMDVMKLGKQILSK